MGIIDIIVLIIITVAFVRGYSNGLIIEVGHIVGIVLGLYLALNFTGQTIEWIDIKGKYSYEIGFVITMIAVVIFVALLSRLLTKFVKVINLSLINRLLGGILNIITVILIMALLLELLESFNKKADLFNKSVFDTFICQALLDLSDMIYPYIEKYIGSSKSIANDIINI